tara:strand:+ start:1880 stop:2059 length:180 start_codon:yes stop_codon:yes gene_type:complete
MNQQAQSIIFALITIVLWSTMAVLSSGLVHLPALLQRGVALTSCGLISLLNQRRWLLCE